MVSFTTTALLASAAVGVLARPHSWGWDHCLTANEAQIAATNYGTLVSAYTDQLADAALAVNFTDYSESVNTLIDTCPIGSAAQSKVIPLLSAGFTNREEFKKGQGQQPPMNFIQLDIWHSCEEVIFRWESTNTVNGTNVKPVVGIIVAHVIEAPAGNKYNYQIDEVHSEFDAGAWIQNLQQAGICKNEAATNSIPQGPASVPAGSASTYAASSAAGAASASATATGSWTTSTSSTVWWTPSTTSSTATATSTWA